jgi:hypothetical protein
MGVMDLAYLDFCEKAVDFFVEYLAIAHCKRSRPRPSEDYQGTPSFFCRFVA